MSNFTNTQLIELFTDYLRDHHQNDADVTLKHLQVSIRVLENFYTLFDSGEEYEARRKNLMDIWMYHLKHSDVDFFQSLYELLYSFRNMSLKYSCPEFEDILDTISHLLSLRKLIESETVSLSEIEAKMTEVTFSLAEGYKLSEVFVDTKRMLQPQQPHSD